MKAPDIQVTIRPRVVQVESLHRAFCCKCGRSYDGYASAVGAWADGHICAEAECAQAREAHGKAVPAKDAARAHAAGPATPPPRPQGVAGHPPARESRR